MRVSYFIYHNVSCPITYPVDLQCAWTIKMCVQPLCATSQVVANMACLIVLVGLTQSVFCAAYLMLKVKVIYTTLTKREISCLIDKNEGQL